MARQEQPHCNTAYVMTCIHGLYQHKVEAWQNYKGGEKIFLQLQEKVQAEAKYLKSFWDRDEDGNETLVMDKMFIPWNCLPAYDDMPEERQRYLTDRHVPRRSRNGYDKYRVFHEREQWLEEVQQSIFSLYHDWHFATHGWTAY